MLPLLISVIPLAVAAAWSPTVLAISVYCVSSPTQPLRRGWYFFAGTAVPVFAASIFLVLAIDKANQGLSYASLHRGLFAAWLNLVVGICLLLAALTIYWYFQINKNHQPSPSVDSTDKLPRNHLRGLFILGFYKMSTSISTMFFSIPAMNTIGLSDNRLLIKLGVVVIFDLIVLLPSLLPPIFYKTKPSLIQKYLRPFTAWVTLHAKEIITWALIITGAYLTTIGAIGVLGLQF